MSMFLAFAVTFPRKIINLYGILPIQAGWLGWLDVAYLVYEFYKIPPMRLGILLSMIPFLLLAVPVLYQGMKFRGKVIKRRAEFESKKLPDEESFHTCSVCGRTDVTNPELEFRVMDDDSEYCLEHIPK